MTRIPIAAGLLLLSLCPAMAQQRDSMFERADSNGDGSITQAEFLDARGRLFGTRDRNADGFVDAADMPPQAAARARLADGIAKARQRLDADGDGKLSKEEFVNGALPIFTRADADGNGTLDAKELEAAKAALRSRASETR